MDAATTAGRNEPVPSASSQSPGKEWRVVPEHSFCGNGGGKEVDRGKSDGRTTYEVQEGTRPLDVDFCSITIDEGGLSEDIARQQQIHGISRRRMELQAMEIELRSQVIAKSEILQMQNKFEAQIEENAIASAKLKEQLQEKEQCIHDLEMQIEEKEMELRAIKIDNEAAWAKEDLLREQGKELATFRRERDNSELERSEFLKQIHDLGEHIQEKENQFLELQEQHRIAQETIIFKDDQLREAQAWIARVQMDTLQSSTSQSLQAELRERTEQFNQYWGYLVHQYTDMERHLLQIIQQLQIELSSEARDHNLSGTSQAIGTNSTTSSTQIGNKVVQFENGNDKANDNNVLVSNGNLHVAPTLFSASDATVKSEHVPVIPFVPPVLGMHAFVPPTQLDALHSFVMHPQGAPSSVSPNNQHTSECLLSNIFPITAVTSNQGFPSQQEETENPCMVNQTHHHTQDEPLRLDALCSYEPSDVKQVNQSECSKSSSNPIHISGPMHSELVEEVEAVKENVLESHVYQCSVPEEALDTSKNNAKSCATQRMNMQDQENGDIVHHEITASVTSQLERQIVGPEPPMSATVLIVPEISTCSPGSHDFLVCDSSELTGGPFSSGKPSKPALLDEKTLLACIVRAVPTGSSGQIRISSTLPNRLAKMLAPLHWHDYKKQYGKLDDFLACHPELFVIEGDFVHLREGAQKIVSAKSAAAKFAAASAASTPCLPESVVVTPVAQGHRSKRGQSTDGEALSTGAPMQFINRHTNSATLQNQQINGFNIVEDVSDVNTKAKTKVLQEAIVFSSVTKKQTFDNTVANGKIVDQSAVTSSQGKSFGNGRHGPGWRHQGRATGSELSARR